MTADTYNRVFTLHGAIMVFLVIIPGIPAALGNFVLPLLLGAKDVAFPRLNLDELLHLRGRRAAGSDARSYWAASIPAGRSTLRTRTTTGGGVTMMVLGAFILGLLLDLHRPELHRHDPQAARARHDLVPAAALRLGHLRHRAHPGARDAGARHHAAAADRRARVPHRHLRSHDSAATRCCSSTSSGSTRTRPCTS